MNYAIGGLVAIGAWFLMNSAACYAMEGRTMTYTFRMAIGYALAGIVFWLLGVLILL